MCACVLIKLCLMDRLKLYSRYTIIIVCMRVMWRWGGESPTSINPIIVQSWSAT